LAVIGFTLMALMIVWLYVSGTSESTKQDLNIAYAKQLVLKIADAADLVYAEGPPAQFVIDLNVPGGIEYANASGKEVLLRVRTGGGLTDVYAMTVANLTGDLSVLENRQGAISLTVKAQRQAIGNVIVNITT